MRIVTADIPGLPLGRFGTHEDRFCDAVRPGQLALAIGPAVSGKHTLCLTAALRMRDRQGATVYDLANLATPTAHARAAVHAMQQRAAPGPDDADRANLVVISEMRGLAHLEMIETCLNAGAAVLGALHARRPGDVPATLRAIGGQRLGSFLASRLSACAGLLPVHRLCPNCRVPTSEAEGPGAHDATDDTLVPIQGTMARARFRRGAGCATCGSTGTLRPAPIMELLVPDDALRDAVRADPGMFWRALADPALHGRIHHPATVDLCTGLATGAFDAQIARAAAALYSSRPT